jgi:ABC-type sugar transport system permease subunit
LLCLASLAAVAALAVFAKVLSPQFLTWTIPLLALAVAWRLYALASLTAVASVLTLVEFPSHYFDLVAREPWAVAVVAIRDLALLAAVALAVAATRRPGAAAAGSPSPARPPRPRPAPR